MYACVLWKCALVSVKQKQKYKSKYSRVLETSISSPTCCYSQSSRNFGTHAVEASAGLVVEAVVVAIVVAAVAFVSTESVVVASYPSEFAFAVRHLLYFDASAAIVDVVAVALLVADPALAFGAVVGRSSMALV